MSATVSSARDPRMLKGVSAFDWGRVGSIGYPVGFVLTGLAVVVFQFHPPVFPPLVLLVPGIIVVAVGLVCLAAMALRRRSEFEAGYTTLGGSPNLDQLDHRTGAVIRRAGEPLLQGGWMSLWVGDQGAPPTPQITGTSAFPAPSPLRRVLSVIGPVLGVAAIAVILLIRTQATGSSGLSGLLWGLGVGVVVIVIVMVALVVSMSRRVRSVTALRPGSLIFTSAKTADLTQGVSKLGGPDYLGSGRIPIVATDEALELWDGDGDTPLLAVPWSEIVDLQPGLTAVNRNSFKAVNVTVVRDDARVLLPLAIYGRRGIQSASSQWANQVFDELQFHLVKR